MSGPYDSYGYGGQQSQYPQQGYGGGGYPPQQGYDQGYQQHQGPPGYGGPPPPDNFGPPRRQDSFGPPQHGGFQHGQAGAQFGAYDASNPQGHAGYYQYGQGGAPPQHQQQGGYGGAGNDAYAQNQAYQAQLGQQQQQQGGQYSGVDVSQHQFQAQSSDPNAPNYDPNAPPMTEQDRGLLGAIGGGFGGHMLGKKANHGFLGTVGGAILGSITEDFLKDKKKHHGSSANSSWGGGSRW